jgi:hypothetical protein
MKSIDQERKSPKAKIIQNKKSTTFSTIFLKRKTNPN